MILISLFSTSYIIRGISETEEAEQTLHIAYHSWEHYSSVRNIDGPLSGPPEIKVIYILFLIRFYMFGIFKYIIAFY